MKKTVIDGSQERGILLGMVVSREIAEHIALKFPDGPRTLTSQVARTLCTWIYDFLGNTEHEETTFAEAIRGAIRHRMPELREDEDRDQMEDYLRAVNVDWQSLVPKSIGDAKAEAEKWFGLRAVYWLTERLQGAVSSGRLDEAMAAVESFQRPVMGDGVAHIFEDAAGISDAFNDEDEVVFTLPGALGQMLGPIIRSDFLCLLAPKKTAKSWHCDMFALRAAMQGCRVLLVDFEMTPKQKKRRLWRQLRALPLKAGSYRLPRFEGGEIIIDEKRYDSGIETTEKDIAEILKGTKLLAQGGCLDLSNKVTKGVGVSDIKALIKAHKRKNGGRGYDLIVIDSPDYIKSSLTKADHRNQIGDVWTDLRGIGQEENCAIIGPSHTGKGSWGKEAKESDVAEDSRKLAVATKVILINQTKKEREFGIQRFSSDTSRDNATKNDSVVILQSLDLGRPYLASKWLSEVRSDLVFRPRAEKDDED